MALRCRLGWHTPESDGVWNHGYAFTRCKRCKRDMVRSLFGEWHMPKGVRVVWRSGPGAVTTLDAELQSATGITPLPPPASATQPVSAREPFWSRTPPRPAPRAAGEASPFDFSEFNRGSEAGETMPAKAAGS